MVPGLTKLLAVDNPNEEVGSFQLRDVFFEDDLYENAFENILMELIYEPSQRNDASMTSEMSNHLFANKDPPMGPSDLASINIQRGRDHGLPGKRKQKNNRDFYIIIILGFCAYYRRIQDKSHDCRLGWDFPYKGFDVQTWEKFQEIYDHPSDIDLFTGGISQMNESGSQLGKVFWAMIREQFRRTMKGDRFFFNHKKSDDLQGVGFTDEARKIIRDRTMSGVICDTTGLTKVPINVFHMNSETIDCTETAKIDGVEVGQLMNFNK